MSMDSLRSFCVYLSVSCGVVSFSRIAAAEIITTTITNCSRALGSRSVKGHSPLAVLLTSWLLHGALQKISKRSRCLMPTLSARTIASDTEALTVPITMLRQSFIRVPLPILPAVETTPIVTSWKINWKTSWKTNWETDDKNQISQTTGRTTDQKNG